MTDDPTRCALLRRTTYYLEIEGTEQRCGVCPDRATVRIKPPNGAILAWCAPCVDRLRCADIKGGQGHLWPAALS